MKNFFQSLRFVKAAEPSGYRHLVIMVMVILVKIDFDMEIQNNQECFVQLWRKLERTRRLLGGQYKRFCIRRVLKTWFGYEATDNFIWEVCTRCEQEGWNELPLPSLYPRKHRELLRAIVSVKLGISYYRVNLRALDKAYSIVFPNSTPINVSKKKRS